MNTTGDLTPAAESAAEMIAAGELTHAAIAERLGISRTTLWAWRRSPGFVARVGEYRAEYRDHIRSRGLANRERRIEALNTRWEALRRTVEERAADPIFASVPGGATGLILHRVRRVGQGVTVETYEIDVALLRELREIERAAAVELGQYMEKVETSGQMTVRVLYETDPAPATAPDAP